MAETIKVAVRVRPLVQREIEAGATIAVAVHNNAVAVNHAGQRRTFGFDHAYWSVDPKDPNFANQEQVNTDIGKPCLENMIKGYNFCVFAYGQTGAGKTHTLSNSPTKEKQMGLIPYVLEGLFTQHRAKFKNDELRIWISFMEIYNEQIRDLLSPGRETTDLKVRDHPEFGAYVPGLTEAPCSEISDVKSLLDFGTKKRVTAATNMNAGSSRSHAVFTIRAQRLTGPKPTTGNKKDDRKSLSSRVNLVDLAGSERVAKSGADGLRLREGCAINQSLTALGLVIKQLAEIQQEPINRRRRLSVDERTKAIPFRASKLTFLLRESLAGNSRTFMVGAVSPASICADETISTLRFASSVKRVKTVALQNVNKKQEAVASLQAEVARLAEMLHNAGAQGAGDVMHVRRPRGDVRDERGVASIRRSSPSAPGRMTKASPTPKVSAKAQRRPVKSAPGLRPCDNSEVTKFLQQIGLPQYAEALYNSGFEDMETLVDIEEDHMRDLGILPGHQVKLRKRLDEFEAGVPVVQINQRKALGDWEEEDDYPAVPVRIAPSMTLLKGATPSEKQISSVQLSWNHLKEIGTPVVAEYFCKKILEISPEIKDLFPPSVRCRYRDWSTDEEEDERCLASSPALRRLFGRVIDAVGSAVAGMQDMNRMVPALTELGLRHVNYNVKEEHFQVFEKALMITLREGLGDLFTKEVEFAWNMAFNFMSATMISGLRSAQSAARSQQTELSKEPNMSTTATPTETPSSASGSGRGRLRAQDAASTPFGVGTELHGKEPYRIERHLQKAIFGDVFEVLGLESQRRLAVKVTELEKMRLQAKHQALVESPLCEIRFAEMMKGLDNVIQLEDTFGDDDRHYVVMELASGGDLMEALELRHSGFQEEHAKKLILDVARGLASLHMRGLAMQVNIMHHHAETIVPCAPPSLFPWKDCHRCSSNANGDRIRMWYPCFILSSMCPRLGLRLPRWQH
ncbi:unnamed protein product [Durusdinium trenchii]|uniref:Kinesin-like protein n=1 Tax=Durusdinium trenchii TaxID=1381693 RepID=A0ABP0IA22_9DINO